MRWQMALYKETSGKAEDADAPEKVVKRVQEVSAVLYHIELVRPVCRHTNTHIHIYSDKHSKSVFLFLSSNQTEHPFKSKKMVWHKLLSKQRRRAVVACFRMTPLYNIPRYQHLSFLSSLIG